MGFQLAVAYGSSLALITVLAMFSAWNRRTGWRRDRTDEVTDALTLWAQIQGEEVSRLKSLVPLEPTGSGTDKTVSADLNALHLILNAQKVNSPISQTSVHYQKSSTQETFAEIQRD